jgi:hypothetical protein
MTQQTEKKQSEGKAGNAIDRFKARPFRQRVFLFLGLVIAWIVLLVIIGSTKKEKETSYSYLIYWISSTFFIFITFKLMFKRYDQ